MVDIFGAIMHFITFLFMETFLQTKKEDKDATLKEKKRIEAQQKLAEEERRRMKEFDDYLVLAKYNP